MSRSAPATPPLLRDLNERTVLDAIRTSAPISRAEISRRVGISKPTVSVVLESLLDAGLVREASDDSDGPKYGATFFEPVHEAALVLGLDLGARFLRGAICDLRGHVRARQDIEMPGAEVHDVLDAAAGLRDRLIAACGLPAEALDGAVAGVPGVIEAPTGRVGLAGNIPGLEGLAVGPALEQRLGVPVSVENDVNLAAVGEHWRGIGQGVENFVFLSVGTGLGAGLVLAGELHRGHHGAAGEVDFALGGDLERENDPAAVGVTAFAAALAERGDLPTTLSAPFDARDIFRAARAGDELARAVVAEEARRIAQHVVPIAAVADVALIVLGGGIGANGDLLLEPIRALLAERCPYPPRVEVSSLGDAAVLTGALAIGLRAALDNVFVNRSRVPGRSVASADEG
jgi:predicted NBD/HSP70 family sugar kinase